MKKRIISIILVAAMLFTVMPVMSTEAEAASTGLTIEQLRQKFPHGKYWNHAGNPGASNSVNNQDGYTSTPCSQHGVVGTSAQTCNGFAPDGTQLSWQCMGYAEKLGYDATGYNPRNNANGWYTYTNASALDNLKPGDIVRYKNNGHSIYVTGVDGDTVTYTDCNSDGHCIIRWDVTISKSTLRSTFTHVRSAPSSASSGTSHTVDTSYGTNFTAYPKVKITAENIFDANHNQINSTSWIGTSDLCTIHEVYTDGCCKVTYPLDSGGTKTVYSKISLFNVSSPKVKYWISDTEYGTVPSEYKAGNRYYFCYKFYDAVTGKNWDEIEDSDYTFNLTFYNPDGSVKYTNQSVFNYDQSWISSFFSEPGTYTAKIVMSGDYSLERTLTFTVQENPKQIHSSTNSVSLNLNGTKSKTIYLWSSGYYSGNAVWHWSSSNSNVSCSWGDWTDDNLLPLTINASSPGTATLTITLKDKDTGTVLDSMNITVVVNVNTTTLSVNTTNTAVVSTGGEMKYFTYTPTTSGKYVIYSTGSDDTKVFLYNANWTELDSDDDDGDGYNFRLEYNLTAGTTYTFGLEYYNTSKTGTISFKFGKVYTVTYNANGGSGAPSSQSKDYGTDITLRSTVPTWTGYTFLGWSTSSTATSATYQPGDNFIQNADTTLYAVWKQGCENGAHSYSYKVTNSPTASATGTLTGTCLKCAGTTTVTLPKLNTTDYTYDVTKAATCEDNGTGRYIWKTTTYGSFDFYVIIFATGHSYTDKVTAPTCTEQGYTTHTCANCGDVYVDSYVKALGHSYGEWYVVTDATCEKDGQKRHDCQNCDHYETAVIEAGGHEYEAVVIEPTCSEWGYTVHTCAHCGHSYTDNYVEIVDHDYQNGSCKYCGKLEVAMGDANGDGKINTTDAKLVMQYELGMIGEDGLNLSAMDVNGDGKYNTTDAKLIMQLELGMITEFPKP